VVCLLNAIIAVRGSGSKVAEAGSGNPGRKWSRHSGAQLIDRRGKFAELRVIRIEGKEQKEYF
jgi:hypothetical protein